MRTRFTGNMALALAGVVVVVVVSQEFIPSVDGWLTFGVSLVALALLAVIRRDHTPGRTQRIAHALKTERAVHMFEAVFAEARNGRRVTGR
jgi:hypothetical protein